MVWYSHLFQNFPQFIVIHTVKGFGIVNKAEIDVFLELSCFFNGADVPDRRCIFSRDFQRRYSSWTLKNEKNFFPGGKRMEAVNQGKVTEA